MVSAGFLSLILSLLFQTFLLFFLISFQSLLHLKLQYKQFLIKLFMFISGGASFKMLSFLMCWASPGHSEKENNRHRHGNRAQAIKLRLLIKTITVVRTTVVDNSNCFCILMLNTNVCTINPPKTGRKSPKIKRVSNRVKTSCLSEWMLLSVLSGQLLIQTFTLVPQRTEESLTNQTAHKYHQNDPFPFS